MCAFRIQAYSKKSKIKSEINIQSIERRDVESALRFDVSILELSDFFINLIIERNIYLATGFVWIEKFHFVKTRFEMVRFSNLRPNGFCRKTTQNWNGALLDWSGDYVFRVFGCVIRD